jgi:hypothetical protein
MFDKVITERTKSTLALLGKGDILKNCYLAGGTAMALQFSHRLSFDLDFFTNVKFDRKLLIQKLEPFDFKTDREAWGTILGKLGDTKFSLFYYQYPLVAKTLDYLGINLASSEDIAAMKIDAIGGRGTKRDFTDLYFLVKKFGNLNILLDFYNQKYNKLEANRFHILKSLEYFADADKEEDPKMLISDYSWEKVKEYLTNEIRKLI